MNDRERHEALEDAVRDAVATHAERAEVPRAVAAPRREAPLVAAIVLGWVLIGWIWLSKPAVVFGPAPVPEITRQEREARLRFAMYLHHQEIVAFAQDSGRLPHSLEELSVDREEAVQLAFDASGGWALTGTDETLSLRLTEGMSADSFLGRSLETLRNSR
jgi:hypothetical protein